MTKLLQQFPGSNAARMMQKSQPNNVPYQILTRGSCIIHDLLELAMINPNYQLCILQRNFLHKMLEEQSIQNIILSVLHACNSLGFQIRFTNTDPKNYTHEMPISSSIISAAYPQTLIRKSSRLPRSSNSNKKVSYGNLLFTERA